MGKKSNSRLSPSITYQSTAPALGRGDKRKLAIIEATISLLAREGLSELTFEAVGKICKISKSHVAYHFPSLSDLLFNSVVHVYSVGQKTVSEYVQKEGNQAKLLTVYVYGTFYWMETQPEHASVAALLGYLATWNPKYKKIQTDIKQIGTDRIAAILQTMSGRKDRSYPALADSVQSLLMGKILYFAATESKRKWRQVRDETCAAIEQLTQ